MLKRRNLEMVTIALVIVMLFGLAGNVMAGGGREEAGEDRDIEISFAWWGAESRHAYTQELSQSFAEKYPGTSFTFQPNSWTGYWERLAVQAAGGNLPTVMQLFISFIPQYAESGMLLDLQPYVDDGTLDVSTIEENLLATGYYKGKLVTIPLSMSARAVVYSPVALAEAGMPAPNPDWTWDDFERMAVQYTRATGNYAIDGYTNHWLQVQLMLLQQGYQLFNEAGDGLGFSDEKPLIGFYRHWQNMVKSGAVYPPDVSATRVRVPSEQSFLALDKAAFRYDSNSIPGWMGNQSLKLAPVPYWPGKVGEDVNWAVPGLSFSVSSRVDEATARRAVQLINWWLNSTEVADVQGTDRGFPASKDVQVYLQQREMTPLQKDTFDYFEYLQNHSGPMPRMDPQGANEVSDRGLLILEEMMSGRITPEEAAKRAFNDFNEILRRHNR
jgi:multiple sugar transport system substrate-binding protein